MPITKLTSTAVEGSTYVINASPTDENDDAITPLTLTWSLQDTNKNYINSREDVSVSSPTTSNDIVLTGNDLAIAQANDNRRRYFTTKATWSGTYGASTALVESCEFKIYNSIDVP